ncbi:TetR/AcrR family transcriptional regulator [Reyranella sp.]|uniref:TetR/AcrR family transcriptional regulator n=1 Tax=Reyranella sp. TaxID=1929291 RepID=UPI003BAB5774
MPPRRQVPETKRRVPRQARSAETVALILEASAQILEARGLAGFTTNAVAERAGVSVGTLYQYFDDKRAILVALARQEVEATLTELRKATTAPEEATVEGRARAAVRAIVNGFRGRLRARKAVVQAVLAQGSGVEVMAPVAAFIAAQPRLLLPAFTDVQLFVLSRALLGTIRAAVLEEQPFFRSRAFEDELVRLIAGYFRAIIAT